MKHSLLLSAMTLTFTLAGFSEAADSAPKPPKRVFTSRQEMCKGFEAFEKVVFKEPGGVYIFDGDTPIASQAELKRLYERFCPSPAKLILMNVNGVDSTWPSSQKRNLTYCISTAFESRHADTVKAMNEAARAWQAVADVRFVYVPTENGRCDESNQNVLFDVRPVNFNEYLARAFFPKDSRPVRNVLIDDSSFTLGPSNKWNLAGILRHELGHVLGFRHEHTRPESGVCFEDMDWRPLTSYDPYSVMHYPQCHGDQDSTLTLTARDAQGAAQAYGPPVKQALTLAKQFPQGQPSGKPTTQSDKYTFSEPGLREVASFKAEPNSVLRARLVSGGTAQMFIELGNLGREHGYDCQATIGDQCALDVPAGRAEGKILIDAAKAGEYQVEFEYFPAKTK